MAKQNSKDGQHINVSVRIRPYNATENENWSPFLEVLSKREIITKSNYNQKRYIFDRVFDRQSSQLEVYNAVVAPLIPEVIGGYNCTVFAYGQTGTGKTHTMEGIHNADNQVNAGIIPRALTHIFKVLSNMHSESSVKVSYLELYNEELFDLLTQSTSTKAIRIFEDKAQKGSVILQGLEELSVTEIGQVYKILEQGSEKRRIASTYLNNASSRSHAVFTIVVHTREITVDGEELVKTGKLNLVDLAGSENISKSGAVDKRAREAGNINQSLLTLGRVITALTEGSTHIPYRESKLTRILQDSLGGRTKTSLIATISSANCNMEETLNTLEYAMRARCIKNIPELNQKISRTALINQYSDTIEKLQRDIIAMQTGTGVYLDEDNYQKLVKDNSSQKAEINAKKTHIQKLEVEITECTEQLHILQDSWTEAANNVERLSNEKKILQRDLILVTEAKEERSRELHKYKEKNIHLESEMQKAVSDFKTYTQTEDTLHRKVSFLYQTSHSNKDVTSAFYNMYNKLFMELMSNIDNCILSSLTQIDEQFVSNNSLKESYNCLKSNADELIKLSMDFRDYKETYFENKEPLESRFHGYFNAVRTFADGIESRSKIFCNELEENLNSLYSLVSDTLDEHPSDIQSIILPPLYTISKVVKNEFSYLHDMFYEYHNNTVETLNDFINHTEKLNDMNKNNFDNMANIQETITTAMNQMKIACALIESGKNQQSVTTDFNMELNQKMHSFKNTTNNTMNTINKIYTSKLQKVEEPVQESINIVNKLIDSAQETKGQVQEPLKNQINDTLNFKNMIKDDCVKCKDDFKTYYEKVKHIESTDDEHYTNLKQLTDNITQKAEDVNTNIGTLLEVNTDIVESTTQVVSVLRECNMFTNKESKALKLLVDEFCDRKLQYPTHAGDTPQKVQPKSSLYVKTLTKNCFTDNKENKENSSSSVNALKLEKSSTDK